MSMTQLVIGTALGFIVAQALLFGLKRLLRRLRRGELPRLPELPDWRGSALIAGFVRYAAPLGASAAVVALGVWSVSDYLAAKAARSATAATLDEPLAPVALPDPHDPANEPTGAVATANEEHPAEASEEPDPYRDSAFKVRTPRKGSKASLKDTLVARAEAKARAELLKDVQSRAQRSQYDCEAAEHAGKYLKAGLDVWGFADWQIKYFPMQGYRGATLSQCQDIKDRVDPATIDLQSTVAQGTHSAAP